MPVMTITLIEGYDAATRAVLEKRLTDAVRATIGAPPDGITVLVHEVPAENYMRGGRHRTPGPPAASAEAVVRAFLAAMEARDLATAEGYLAEEFSMLFPGGRRFATLAALVDWSKTRYRDVGKRYERIEEVVVEDGVAVYAFGTLAGAWPDGTAFEGVRFIDRFTVVAGKLVDQRVWNDMGEARPY